VPQPQQQPLVLPPLPANAHARLEEALLALWNGLESRHSRRGYREDWGRWCAWLEGEGVHPLVATTLHVQRYLSWMHDASKQAKATRARALSVVRQTYAALVRSGILVVNPARDAQNPRVSSDPRTPWLEESALARLLTAPPPDATWIERRNWLLTVTVFGLGLRRSELVQLTRASFTVGEHGITVTGTVKGNKQGLIPVPGWLWQLLDVWCRENNVVSGPIFFCANTRVALTDQSVWIAVRKTAAAAGVEHATPHALRRSFATVTGLRGVSIEDRQLAMQHVSKTTTERYDKAVRTITTAPGEVLENLVGRPRWPVSR